MCVIFTFKFCVLTRTLLFGINFSTHRERHQIPKEGLAAAEVVVLPYNTLLSSQARKSVGISLKNALIVIDEAHNVPETLRNISSCQLSLKVAEAALSQLMAYTRRYSGRLAGRNLFYLGQIRRCVCFRFFLLCHFESNLIRFCSIGS